MRGQEYDHIFLDSQHMTELLRENVAAYTEIDGNRYCVRFKQFVEDKINVYIVDCKGANDIIKSFPKAEIMSVLILRKNIYIDKNRKNRNIKLPSRDDVSVTLCNNGDLKNSVSVLKSLIELNGELYFKKHHPHMMDLDTKVQYHFKMVEYHKQIVEDCLEELECMYYKE